MEQNCKNLFAHFNDVPEPPADLLDKIMKRIRWEKHLKIVKWRLIIFALMLIASAATIVPAFQTALSAITESNFAIFFSLLFSNAEISPAYWGSLIIALLESLPAISISIFLAAIFTFLESLKYTAQNINIIKFNLPADSAN